MYKRTKKTSITDYRAITTPQLCDMLNVGRATAEEVGKKAGAKVKVGRRVIWNVAKIQAYLDKVAE